MGFAYGSAPQEWHFADERREWNGSDEWRCPVELVRSGRWAALWRADETCRGGGTASALLPVLALHAWPGKHSTLGVRNAPDPESFEWTGWEYQSHRKLAKLAGISLETVGKTMDRLDDMGLLQRRTVPPPKNQGGRPRTDYRLSRELYSTAGAEWSPIAREYFYRGLWHVLPDHSVRHLYITLAALDPVRDEASFGERLVESAEYQELEPADAVEEYRRKHPLSLSDLAEASGMRRSTVDRALPILLQPIFSDGAARFGLVKSGPAKRQDMRWFAIDRRADGWGWKAQALNVSRERIEALRAKEWPQVAQRQAAAAAKKRARVAAAKKGLRIEKRPSRKAA